MKLENIRANSKYILMKVEDSKSAPGFTIVDTGDLVSGEVIHAGVNTGLEEFSVNKNDIKVLFKTGKSIDVGFGFTDIKMVHIDDVVAYVVEEKE